MDFSEIKYLCDKLGGYPLVYLAGPYKSGGGSSATTDPEVGGNILKATRFAKALWGNGVGVLSPHLNTNFEHNGIDQTMVMSICHQMQMCCDALVVMPDSENSEGVNEEKKFADSIGQPIFQLSSCDAIHDSQLIMDIKQMIKYPKQYRSMRILHTMMYFLHVDKNKDYSPRNILGTGIVGVATRIWDKCARFMNLIGFNISTGEYCEPKIPKNESIEDTLIDMANYALIALIYRQGRWAK
uniref:Nucleotide modification associated domain-containing protein n=1 Tax=viral metagenome TaxID=1070528 RepID=A0A6M3L7D9_9ZZZZ